VNNIRLLVSLELDFRSTKLNKMSEKEV